MLVFELYCERFAAEKRSSASAWVLTLMVTIAFMAQSCRTP